MTRGIVGPTLVNEFSLLFPWGVKVQSLKTEIFLIRIKTENVDFRCGEETRIIPRILQVKSRIWIDQ